MAHVEFAVKDQWVRLKEPVEIDGKKRHYGKFFGEIVSAGRHTGQMVLCFPIPKPFNLDKETYPDLYRALIFRRDELDHPVVPEQGMAPSPGGKPNCKSGSLESGGDRTFCSCDTCF